MFPDDSLLRSDWVKDRSGDLLSRHDVPGGEDRGEEGWVSADQDPAVVLLMSAEES